MSTTAHADDEAQIRRLVDERVAAVLARDAAGATAANAPDIETFDVVPPLRNVGADGVRARTDAWLAGYADGPRYAVRDLRVVAGAEVAFAYYLYHVEGTLRDGGEVEMWVRATLCFRKMDGAWRLVHEHDSVPFDPDTGRARLDLAP